MQLNSLPVNCVYLYCLYFMCVLSRHAQCAWRVDSFYDFGLVLELGDRSISDTWSVL